MADKQKTTFFFSVFSPLECQRYRSSLACGWSQKDRLLATSASRDHSSLDSSAKYFNNTILNVLCSSHQVRAKPWNNKRRWKQDYGIISFYGERKQSWRRQPGLNMGKFLWSWVPFWISNSYQLQVSCRLTIIFQRNDQFIESFHITAVLVFQNNKTAAMLVFQTNPLGVELLLM